MWNRPLLKEEAKKLFTYSGNYWKCVLVALIMVIISGGIGGITGEISGITNDVARQGRNRTHRTYDTVSYETADIAGVDNASGTFIYRDSDGNEKSFSFDSDYDDFDFDDFEDFGYYEDFGDYEDFEDDDRGDWDDEVLDDYLGDMYKKGLGLGSLFAGLSVGFLIVVGTIITIIALAIGFVFKAFVANPLNLGCKAFFLDAYSRPSDLRDIGRGFKTEYLSNVKTLFLRDLFIFLWSLLFIVPGIIKAYEYRMMAYLIIDNPSMTTQEAFDKSKEMMMGKKWNAFVYDLSFIGWFLLSAITCGIVGIFYSNPYYYAADANLYRAIKMGGSTGYASSVYRASATVYESQGDVFRHDSMSSDAANKAPWQSPYDSAPGDDAATGEPTRDNDI